MSELITINLCLEGSEDSLLPGWMRDFQEKWQITVKSKEDFENNGMDYLLLTDEKLAFYSKTNGSMSFDFSSMLSYHESQNYRLTQELLYRALGLKKSDDPRKTIWDLTCGTGKDLMLMASYRVHSRIDAFERNPIIFLLLKDALQRLNEHLAKSDSLNISIYYGNSSAIFPQGVESLRSCGLIQPDVIYYDPMYPDKKKSALPRKEMQIFKNLVGSDVDCDRTLSWALKTARERVVVKRPPGAPPLKENPTASYAGKSVRYDMYKII